MSQGPGEGVRYMNRATRGLQNSESPTSDNLTPQETTTQDMGETGIDGRGLPCAGSRVVADSGCADERFEPSKDPGTIVPDRTSSFKSQSLTEDQEVGDEPIKTDRIG